MTNVKTLAGHPMPTHECAPRSAIARAMAVVFTQADGSVWHHQLLLRDETSNPIAIRFCPFCGVDLERRHFQ